MGRLPTGSPNPHLPFRNIPSMPWVECPDGTGWRFLRHTRWLRKGLPGRTQLLAGRLFHRVLIPPPSVGRCRSTTACGRSNLFTSRVRYCSAGRMGTGGGDGRATRLCARPTVSRKYHPWLMSKPWMAIPVPAAVLAADEGLP